MRWRGLWAGGVVLGIWIFLAYGPALAVIKNPPRLSQVLAEKFIFQVKVARIDPEKPALVLEVEEVLKGDVPFKRLPVVLTGDSDGKKANDPARLLKRVAPGVPLLVFTSLDGRKERYVAFAYTNGTWLQMIGHVDKENAAAVRWSFTHCEPYLRRTFKGSTAELRDVIVGGLARKKAPPEPDLKEPPGLGPEIPPAKSGGRKSGVRGQGSGAREGPSLTLPAPRHLTPPLFAVIPTFVVVGPLALLAALFPAVFGGLILVLRRWMILLSVASLNSTVFLIHGWFGKYLKDSWWGSATGLWTIMTLVTLLGALWSWQRYRRARPEDQAAALRPRRSEQVVLWLSSLLGAGIVVYCLARGTLRDSPWKELAIFWAVAWAGTLYVLLLRLLANREPPARRWPPPEGIMLWVMVAVCAGLGAMSLPQGPPQAFVTGGMDGTSAPGQRRLDVAWTFEAPESGTIVSSPCVAGARVYVAAAHNAGLTRTFGAVYCLDRNSGQVVWTFPGKTEEDMKQVSLSSPCLADGFLYIGEGFHDDTDCKLYCLRADTGAKVWQFQTKSQGGDMKGHIESSPCVVNGRVYFGAGDDGVYCLDTRTGQEIWNFGGLHVDTSPAVVGNRLYAGTGYGKAYEAFCLDSATGKPVWRLTVDLPVWGSPTVAGARVFFGLGNGDFLQSADQPRGAVLCVDAITGQPSWQTQIADAVLTRPAVSGDRVYVGSRDHYCYCLDVRDGRVMWRQDVGSPVVAAPALAGSSLCVAASGGRVCCLHVESGAVAWTFDVAKHSQKKAQLFSSPVADGGRVYFGAGLDNLFQSAAVLYCLED
jgi:outer membrane protein assembly factor BamB